MNLPRQLSADDRWRRRVVLEARLRAGDSVIDACCGEGRLTALLSERVGPFGRVEGVDGSSVRVAAAATGQHALVQAHFQVGDVLDLPFDTGTFDAATMYLGLRRLPDVPAGLRELVRVVRPGGRIVILELALPAGRVRHAASITLCGVAAPIAARVAGGDSQTWRELPRDLERSPSPISLDLLMAQAGMTDVRRTSLGAGFASLHRGTARPA